MNAERGRLRARVLLAPAVALILAACGGGSGHGGSAFTFLNVDRITANSGGVVTSSLDATGTSTAACVTLSNNLKNPGVTAPSPLDSVTVTSYTVSFTRFDGGPAPGPFTVNTAFTVPAGVVSGTPASASGNTATAVVVLIPAQAKRQSPLEPRPRLPLSATADILFRGRNGRGQDLSTQGAITVNFVAGDEPAFTCAAGSSAPTPSPTPTPTPTALF